MKKLLASLLLLAASGSVFAQTGEILVTANKSGGDIELVFESFNEGGVVALQYEMKLGDMKVENIDLSNCVSAFGSSKLAGCAVAKNVLRVGIIAEGLSEFPTGEIGRITLQGVSQLPSNFKIENAAVVGKEGNLIKIEALADFNGLRSEFTKPQPGHNIE